MAVNKPNRITESIDDPVDVTQGGTGETTQTEGFDSLSPTTTKGDLIVSDGTDNVRLAVGSDGEVLTADSAESAGVKWASGAGGDSFIAWAGL